MNSLLELSFLPSFFFFFHAQKNENFLFFPFYIYFGTISENAPIHSSSTSSSSSTSLHPKIWIYFLHSWRSISRSHLKRKFIHSLVFVYFFGFVSKPSSQSAESNNNKKLHTRASDNESVGGTPVRLNHDESITKTVF